jgi:hypothetical protein
MLNSGAPIVEQIRRDKGANELLLAQIKSGQSRPHRNGVDITDEAVADAQVRLATAISILAVYDA